LHKIPSFSVWEKKLQSWSYKINESFHPCIGLWQIYS
jgi:hypothetical protein